MFGTAADAGLEEGAILAVVEENARLLGSLCNRAYTNALIEKTLRIRAE